MGEDYASQTRSEFDSYNPHLYNYLQPLLFYKTPGLFQFRLNVEKQVKFSHECEINYTRFHAFMLSSTMALMRWRENRWVNYFL